MPFVRDMTWTNNEYTYNHANHRREGIDLLGTESVLAIGEFLVFEPEPHPSHNLVTASELDESILIKNFIHVCEIDHLVRLTPKQ